MLRADLKVDPRQQLDAALYSEGPAAEAARSHSASIARLAGIVLKVHRDGAPPAGAAMRSTPEFALLIEIPAAERNAQRQRLDKEVQQLEKNIANSRRQLGDENFLGRAPARVIDGIRGKLGEYEAQLEKSRAALAAL
jgi:valyl-tRNA synthetase